MKALNKLAGIAAGIIARELWARRKWPRPVIYKTGGGFGETVLGLLRAYPNPMKAGELKWSTTWEPRFLTELDEKRLKAVNAKLRRLSRQRAKLLAGAYSRGWPVNIDEAGKITAEREARS